MQEVMGRVIAFATELTIMLSAGAFSLNGIRQPYEKGIATLAIIGDDWDEGTSRD